MSEACDNCKEPGFCCKEFQLNGLQPWGYTAIETKKQVMARLKKNKLTIFKPIKKGKWYWFFKCTKLDKNGRCTIYKDRPDLCKSFVPGTGLLCSESKSYIKWKKSKNQYSTKKTKKVSLIDSFERHEYELKSYKKSYKEWKVKYKAWLKYKYKKI